MTKPEECRLIGRWRIITADLWDRGYLDLCGPAMMVIGSGGDGEISFAYDNGDEAVLQGVREGSQTGS